MNAHDVTSHTSALSLNGAARLTDLGVIRVVGDEAAKYLQGQLTQDVVLMKPGESRLAALCNPKGRMVASFVMLKRAPDDILLICSRDILAATLKRLSMFVMRSKAKLSDATEQFHLFGLIGQAAQEHSVTDGQHLCPLAPADDSPRTLLVSPAEAPEPSATPLDLALWHWADVRSGVALVTQPIVEAFVPQMLNYESIGGVNFKKGCYPGQEVVARSQFRGAIKRRAFVAQVDGTTQAGQEVFTSADADQPCGVIALAAPAPGGGTAVIASLQLAALDSIDALTVGGPGGPALTGWRLPYQLLADI
ncbi:YgfZ/GcvT domain-containing protein [Ottowia thiooxydans]|uniref:CAF17-like 4Fe-4S cluster assembly/insertion protein YgfZ n=1 Tax=Ottowia thiooxydans TaxID=219182 RepID=UPI0003FD4BD9|nr:folate-binding protein YgfZ [Ottowia thiooxydans]